jgi:hypothetical protein
MAAIAIRRPALLQQFGNMRRQRPPVGDGANSFKQYDLVQLSSGVLQLVPTTTATASTQLVWGQTPDDSKAAGLVPPAAFFGENHYCFDIHEATIEMNLVNGANGGVGDATNNNGNAGVTLASYTIGAAYGIFTTATNYVGVQMVDTNNTTNTLVVAVGISPNQTTSDNNPRVLVKIPQAKVQ